MPFTRAGRDLHLAVWSLNDDATLVQAGRVRIRVDNLSHTFDEDCQSREVKTVLESFERDSSSPTTLGCRLISRGSTWIARAPVQRLGVRVNPKEALVPLLRDPLANRTSRILE